jgi:hypothetical protein
VIVRAESYSVRPGLSGTDTLNRRGVGLEPGRFGSIAGPLLGGLLLALGFGRTAYSSPLFIPALGNGVDVDPSPIAAPAAPNST